MREIKSKSTDTVANVLEQAWLMRYPWPTRMIFDRGSEFKAELCQMIKKRLWHKGEAYYDTKPQANAIVERVHQTIGNMIRTFELYDNDRIDDDDPWSGILTAVMAKWVNPFWVLSCSPAQDSSRDKVRRRRVLTCDESHEFGPAQSSHGSSSLSVDRL